MESSGGDRTLCFFAMFVADRTSYIQSIVAFGHHFDPAKRGETPRIGRELRFLNRSLRHIAARSDIARSGTPNAASPFPGSDPGYLTLVCFVFNFGLLIIVCYCRNVFWAQS